MEVSHHAFNDGDWKSTKPLVFVLDNMADLDAKDNKKSKKNKGKNLTHRNFGAFLDIGKVKSAQHLSLAWRCRLLDHIPYLSF